jgi:glycosyltransferase involved in cell wall biosynthesis
MSAPTRPAVTAIVPTHNRRETLPMTLQSILQQGSVELEVIVVDDGSSDATSEWLKRVEDPRLRILRHEEPLGVAAARNAGIAEATTEYVAFCDDDDVWAPDKLATQLDAIAGVSGAAWSCTSAVSFFVDDDRRIELVYHQPAPASEHLLAGLLANNVVPGGGSSVLARADLVREVGGFRGGMAEDWDLWIRLALAAPAAIAAAPLSGYRIWRKRNASRSSDVRALEAGTRAVRQRHRVEATALGVTQPSDADEVYLAKIALRGNLRWESFVRHVRLGRRAPKKLGWACAALVSPSAVDRATDRRSALAVPPEWRDQTLSWLTPLVAGTGTP